MHATLGTAMGCGHLIMKIEHLRIDGFKSWRSVDFRLAPITGLFGGNSSGKSSLIQFLLMLKQTKEATDRSLALDFGGPSSYTDLGSFRDVVFGKEEDGRVEWRIGWDLADPLEIIDSRTSPPGILFFGNQISLSSAVELRHGQPITAFLSYEFSGETFSLQRKDPQSRKYQLQPSDKNKPFQFIRKQ
jgi:hypothetical protein